MFKLRSKKNKLNRDSFFYLVANINNNQILDIFLAEGRFLSTVIDEAKIHLVRTELQYMKRQT
jgi:hypothetical protein